MQRTTLSLYNTEQFKQLLFTAIVQQDKSMRIVMYLKLIQMLARILFVHRFFPGHALSKAFHSVFRPRVGSWVTVLCYPHVCALGLSAHRCTGLHPLQFHELDTVAQATNGLFTDLTHVGGCDTAGKTCPGRSSTIDGSFIIRAVSSSLAPLIKVLSSINLE